MEDGDQNNKRSLWNETWQNRRAHNEETVQRQQTERQKIRLFLHRPPTFSESKQTAGLSPWRALKHPPSLPPCLSVCLSVCLSASFVGENTHSLDPETPLTARSRHTLQYTVNHCSKHTPAALWVCRNVRATKLKMSADDRLVSPENNNLTPHRERTGWIKIHCSRSSRPGRWWRKKIWSAAVYDSPTLTAYSQVGLF